MGHPVITAEHLSKRYRIGRRQRYKTLRDTLADAVRLPVRRARARNNVGGPVPDDDDAVIWALNDVSFEIGAGEAVAVIGRNGAGKSTLLKILSRITEPTSGQAEIFGRVGSLLEVGTGFHPELSGRENVYLNGAILGMRRREIEARFDEIVAFAEVERFIDTAVKYYSSGMYLRLAFAVAAHLEPEILLVDEVLAVGDAGFQRKCLAKMGSVAKQGRTVVFVTHNLGAAGQLCEKTMWIDQGRVALSGGTPTVVQAYLASMQAQHGDYVARPEDLARPGTRVALRRVSVTDAAGTVVDAVANDADCRVRIDYVVASRTENVRLGFRLHAGDGTIVFTTSDSGPAGTGTLRDPGLYTSVCTIPGNLLNEGQYYLSVGCDRPMHEVLFMHEHIVSFAVVMTGGAAAAVREGWLGVVRPSLHWDVRQVRDGNTMQEAGASSGSS
jgi:lipopolysaccharide transport system ATP-binding protein